MAMVIAFETAAASGAIPKTYLSILISISIPPSLMQAVLCCFTGSVSVLMIVYFNLLSPKESSKTEFESILRFISSNLAFSLEVFTHTHKKVQRLQFKSIQPNYY